MNQTISYLHNGTIGDVIACMPGLREIYRKTGKKAKLYLENGQKAIYYEGAVHPTVDENGVMVMLNQTVIDMLVPLLNSQEYIEEAKVWEHEKINIDLNDIRITFINIPNGCLSRWYFYVFPDMACDLSKEWLSIPETEQDLAKGKIIISRSERYLNSSISYKFLKPYEKNILFIGTELEYVIFKTRFGLDIQHLIVNDLLEMAQAISQSKFHISNQTMAFQISQGIKHPRILELCKHAPNVIPVGENAFDFYWQYGLEYYFHSLNGTLNDPMVQLMLQKATKESAAIKKELRLPEP